MQNKKEQWAVLKRLMSYLKPYGLLTFLALSFLLATTVIKSVIPLVASHFIDQYLSNLNQLAVTVLLVYYGLYILQTKLWYSMSVIFSLHGCPTVLLGIFVGMPLLIWRNWACPILTRRQQALSSLV